jgi:hypothetical protein
MRYSDAMFENILILIDVVRNSPAIWFALLLGMAISVLALIVLVWLARRLRAIGERSPAADDE